MAGCLDDVNGLLKMAVADRSASGNARSFFFHYRFRLLVEAMHGTELKQLWRVLTHLHVCTRVHDIRSTYWTVGISDGDRTKTRGQIHELGFHIPSLTKLAT
jgi:hypothetical protein